MTDRDAMNGPEAINQAWGDPAALRLALDRPELDFFDRPDEPTGDAPEPARRAAFDLARELGRCRLRGVDLGEDDGVLPLAIARAAAERWRETLDRLIRIAGELPDRLDRAADPIEIEDLCLDLLGDRLDAWAAFLAIDEAYTAALQEGGGPDALPDRLMPLLEAIDRFDEALRAHLDLLTIVADYPTVEHGEARLAPEFRTFLPWFLDGSIRRRADELEEDALAIVRARDRREDEDGAHVVPMPRRELPRPWLDLRRKYKRLRFSGDAPPIRREWPQSILWRSPGDDLRAELSEPDFRSAEDEPWLLVRFRPSPGKDDGPLRSLISGPTPVSLAGVPAIIQEENGRAYTRFPAGQALHAPEGPILIVGAEVWELVEEE